MTSPRPDIWQVVELRFEPRFIWLQSLGSQPFCYAICLLYFLEQSWGDGEGRLFINREPLLTLQPFIRVGDELNSSHTASLLPPTGQMDPDRKWIPNQGCFPVDQPWYKTTPDERMAYGWVETNYYYNHYLCNIWAGGGSWQFLVRSYVCLTEQSLIENVNHLEDH